MWGRHPSCSSEARPDGQPWWTALGGQRPRSCLCAGLGMPCSCTSSEVLAPPGRQEGQGGCRFRKAGAWPSPCLLTSQKPQATNPTVYPSKI